MSLFDSCCPTEPTPPGLAESKVVIDAKALAAAPARAPPPPPLAPPPTPPPARSPEIAPITLHLVSARGLGSSDGSRTGASTTGCFVEVVGLKKQSKVVRNSLEVVWDEELSLEEHIKGTDLVLQLWDKDPTKPDILLGKLVIPAADVEKEPVTGEFELSEAGTRTSFLKLRIKPAGKDYAGGPPPEYKVTLQKRAGDTCGLVLDAVDKNCVQVIGIKDGLIANFNKGKALEHTVKVGHFLVAVNLASDAAAMVEELYKAGNLVLTLRRKLTFFVDLEKPNGHLQMGLEYVKTNPSITITSIGEGPAAEWNKNNPSKEIQVGDKIESVLGKSNKTAQEMFQMLLESRKVNLEISRPAPQDGTALYS